MNLESDHAKAFRELREALDDLKLEVKKAFLIELDKFKHFLKRFK